MPNPARFYPDMEKIIRSRLSIDGAVCDIDHLRSLLLLANVARAVPGDAAELGVLNGGTARLISEVLRDRPVHLFDTFAGIPENDKVTGGHKKGDFATVKESEIREFMKPCPNAVFHVGFFPATAAALHATRFSFAHFDGDIYQSCKAFIEFFWPRMNTGGIMVFHDYGMPSCPGVRTAVDEAGLDIVQIVWHQCFVVKT